MQEPPMEGTPVPGTPPRRRQTRLERAALASAIVTALAGLTAAVGELTQGGPIRWAPTSWILAGCLVGAISEAALKWRRCGPRRACSPTERAWAAVVGATATTGGIVMVLYGVALLAVPA